MTKTITLPYDEYKRMEEAIHIFRNEAASLWDEIKQCKDTSLQVTIAKKEGEMVVKQSFFVTSSPSPQ